MDAARFRVGARLSCSVSIAAVWLILITGTALGAPPALDSTRVSGSILVSPTSFYSSTMGFGVGVGYRVRGLFGGQSSLMALAKPSQHRGIYELSFASGDLTGSRPYAASSIYFEDTGRGRFYGIGPYSSRDSRVFVEYKLTRLRLALGLPQRMTRIALQPALELYHASVDTFRNDDEQAYQRLSPVGQNALAGLVRRSTSHVAAGIEAFLGRVGTQRPERSVQAAVHRVQSTRDANGFWRAFLLGRYDLTSRRSHLILRAAYSSVFRGASAAVPFYLLPKLDSEMLPGFASDRFRGRSMLVVNANFERALFDVFGYAGVDLVLIGSVGSVYSDIASEFTPRISFARHVSQESRAPLRPSAALGFRAFAGNKPMELRAVVGFSPEHMSIITVSFKHRIDYRTGLF